MSCSVSRRVKTAGAVVIGGPTDHLTLTKSMAALLQKGMGEVRSGVMGLSEEETLM